MGIGVMVVEKAGLLVFGVKANAGCLCLMDEETAVSVECCKGIERVGVGGMRLQSLGARSGVESLDLCRCMGQGRA